MPATALPPSGDLPAGPKICDASGMAEIHRMFRAGFGEARALIDGVREGDTAHASIVADHLAMLSTGLHAHHEGEDSMLWGTLEQRAPSCQPHVERMKAQHAQLLVHLTALDSAMPTWRANARSVDAARLGIALDGVNAALNEHLGDEEHNIVPVMETVLTQTEVDALGEHGRKATPKGRMFFQLGAILAAQPDGGAEWQRKHLPPPVRLIWRWMGKPKYEANRAELVGDRPV
ncbi:hemerythrin domain-containing protein [Agromyces sp. SYSU K20354]|uniref:hemerythrin domain-containing protein n=1 Tax=Agromyces cavernae TaxID=2898659 RepID=UPI001E5182AF|nr:hemerythrin domain-containing protein [Agromyces cavernae]MCD2441463.1 hemerythrin domain-containing protein [Agromyces cavernae]